LLLADPASIGSTWHRARLLGPRPTFSPDEMGAPPPESAGQGRANPAGIPYLYLGSQVDAAIAELRPHTGDRACVAAFEVPSLRVVDLRHPRAQVSPFLLDGADAVGQLRADLPLLERLGSELTRPVLPHSAN